MSPIIFFPGFWRSRSRSMTNASSAKDAAPRFASTVPAEAPVGPRPIMGETERPMFRRPRRYRRDGVLGLRWLA